MSIIPSSANLVSLFDSSDVIQHLAHNVYLPATLLLTTLVYLSTRLLTITHHNQERQYVSKNSYQYAQPRYARRYTQRFNTR